MNAVFTVLALSFAFGQYGYIVDYFKLSAVTGVKAYAGIFGMLGQSGSTPSP